MSESNGGKTLEVIYKLYSEVGVIDKAELRTLVNAYLTHLVGNRRPLLEPVT